MAKRMILSRNTARALRIMRYDVGITQSEFAQYIGVSLSSVKSWESGRAMPSPRHYKMIMNFIWDNDDIDIDDETANKIWERIEMAREQDIHTTEMLKIIPDEIPPMTAAQNMPNQTNDGRKYNDCINESHDCKSCALSSYGLDCHSNKIEY